MLRTSARGEISEISAATSTCRCSASAKPAKKSPRYPATSRYTRSGAPGAPSARLPHCTVIFGGVQANKCVIVRRRPSLTA